MNQREVMDKYKTRLPLLEQLLEEVKYILKKCLIEREIELQRLEGRVKTVDSFMEKAESYELANPLEEIEDQCGLRIVCLFLGQIDTIAAIIRNNFTVLSEDNKIEHLDEHSFGYMAFHFTCKLPPYCTGPRYDAIKQLPFEIQVRTIAMDTWATISHYIQYKKTLDVPKWLRKDFDALGALFYIADTHFEQFYRKAADTKLKITASVESEDLKSVELNVDTLREFLRTKYPDREAANDQHYSDLLTDVLALGYKNLSQLDADLSKTEAAFIEMEKAHPPGAKPKKGNRYSDVGATRCSLRFVHEDFLKKMSVELIREYKEFQHLVPHPEKKY